MKTQVADTSMATYAALTPAQLQPKQAAVMALFKDPGIQYTREHLANRLGWKEASVCGRVNSLVSVGLLCETEGGKTLSGRSAKLVHLPRPQQRGLF